MATAGTPRRVSLCDGLHVDATPRCYPPSQVGKAERQMPVRVVSPRGLVWRVTGLRLHEVDVDSGAAMDYLFGRLTADRSGIPDYGSTRFRYMVVREIAGHMTFGRAVVYRTQGEAQWHFAANVPGRDLALHIFTNVGRTAVARVGYAMLKLGQSATSGKC